MRAMRVSKTRMPHDADVNEVLTRERQRAAARCPTRTDAARKYAEACERKARTMSVALWCLMTAMRARSASVATRHARRARARRWSERCPAAYYAPAAWCGVRQVPPSVIVRRAEHLPMP